MDLNECNLELTGSAEIKVEGYGDRFGKLQQEWWDAQTYTKIVLRADYPNGNGHIYPRSVCKMIVDKFNENPTTTGSVINVYQESIPESQIAFFVRKLVMIGDDVIATVEVNKTYQGKIFNCMMEEEKRMSWGSCAWGSCTPERCKIAFRTHGYGSVEEDADGNLVIADDYRLISINAVYEDEAAKL